MVLRGLAENGHGDLAHQLAVRYLDALANAANDAGQCSNLLEELAGRDPLGNMRDEDVFANREVAMLAEVAGHEVGRAGCNR